MRASFRQHAFSVRLPLLAIATVIVAGCEPAIDAEGEAIVKSTCRACHAQGINGAPIIGNKKMWGPRIGQGMPVLVQHATEGFGAMPAKGGNTALTDEQIAKAVGYMVGQLNQK